MAKNKKILKVDKLIIRANEIVVEKDGKEIGLEQLQKQSLTQETETDSHPWGFFGPGPEDDLVEEERVEEKKEEVTNDEDEQQGWSWV